MTGTFALMIMLKAVNFKRIAMIYFSTVSQLELLIIHKAIALPYIIATTKYRHIDKCHATKIQSVIVRKNAAEAPIWGKCECCNLFTTLCNTNMDKPLHLCM